MKIKNKCFGCEKRTVGCHSTCEDYLEFRKQKDNEKIQIKKKEVEDAINNRYNRFIEILHNDKDKKFINLQYLDLMEDFNKKNSKYKMDYYVAKNDRFKEIQIPSSFISKSETKKNNTKMQMMEEKMKNLELCFTQL